ncbi:MAG: acetyltransferase [Phycisphaerae bacterium]|nr:acetyltransferase [Phycisphaerae bacterium]
MLPTIHGRGSHGLVVFDALQAANPSAIVKWTDDKDGSRPKPTDYFICAVGDNRVRDAMGGDLTVIHPTACVSGTAEVGRGAFVGAFAFVGPKAKIGDCAIINNGAVIEHECVVGRAAHVASGAVLSGRAQVGEGTLIGAGAVVRLGQHVGAWATVGAGAVVVKDVPDNETWVGNPARKLR